MNLVRVLLRQMVYKNNREIEKELGLQVSGIKLAAEMATKAGRKTPTDEEYGAQLTSAIYYMEVVLDYINHGDGALSPEEKRLIERRYR